MKENCHEIVASLPTLVKMNFSYLDNDKNEDSIK